MIDYHIDFFMKLQCPNCKSVFTVDENEYASILSQVKNAEFEAEVNRRIKEIEQRHAAEGKALQAERDLKVKEQLDAKERERQALSQQIERLNNRIDNFETEKRLELTRIEADNKEKILNLISEKDGEIASLRSEIQMNDKQRELDVEKERRAMADEIHERERRISQLSSQLEAQEISAKNRELELAERHKVILDAKNEEIEHYKELKSKLSTKLLGETLERHCSALFNRARSQGQYLTAYFEKDNDASGGSKGDFIFRDFMDGDEYISIMFEMKNEDEATKFKHRNEDFFAKLDKDRHEKHCEYAVLVSTLEADNEFYNEGIVDVSFRYEKMFVIRPQFFMSLIGMLSRASRRGAERLIELRQRVEIAEAQSVDVTNFEKKVNQFKDIFFSYTQAYRKKQEDALAGIDKVIESLEKQAEALRKVRAQFETSEQKLLKANERLDTDLSVKKLTRGNPTMKRLFDQARQDAQTDEV